jgi:large subunit ribosomal protein L18e
MQIRQKNQTDAQLIIKLREESYKGNAIWKKVADSLNKPTRSTVIVNLSRLDRFTKDNETVVVPGKVLASGELSRKLTIAAKNFSKEAREKIKKSGSSITTIADLMKKDPSGKNIKIIE